MTQAFPYTASVRSCFTALLLFCFVPGTAPAQSPSPTNELQSKYLTALAHQGEEEIRVFQRAGGKPSSPDHPGRKWAARFWEYRAAHPGTPAAAQAVSEALWMWLAAEQWQAMRDAVDSLALNDSAWNDSFRPLLLAADAQRNYSWLERKLTLLSAFCANPSVCATAWMYRGHTYARQQKHDEAKGAASQAVRQGPSALQEKLQAGFDEIGRLSIGLPAPQFTTKTLDGKPVALSDFRGKVVLLNFWASW